MTSNKAIELREILKNKNIIGNKAKQFHAKIIDILIVPDDNEQIFWPKYHSGNYISNDEILGETASIEFSVVVVSKTEDEFFYEDGLTYKTK